MIEMAFHHDLFDRHFATFLEGRCGLAAADKPAFRVLVADLSAAMAAGHVCLPVTTVAAELLSHSPLVSDGTISSPLVLHAGYLYLHRYYRYECRLAEQLQRFAQVRHPVPSLEELLDSCFPVEEADRDRQRLAARLSLTRSLTLITGGPGTGKTFTVARILALLLQVYGPGLRLALTAPTGKAAIRLQQSVAAGLAGLNLPSELAGAVPQQAATLHRLLGVLPDSSRFRYNGSNPLPVDVVVVDEASMIDLALMSKLVDALGATTRLILLGDCDQLAPVESGAVLADCSQSLSDNTVELDQIYRFDSDISRLAALIKSQNGDGAWHLLDSAAEGSVSLVRDAFLAKAVARYRDYMAAAVQAKDTVEIQGLFTLLNRFRVLCAVRQGRWGTEMVNAAIEGGLCDAGCSIPSGDTWYLGRPVLVNSNDYSLDLFNGDVGICLPDRLQGGCNTVWFERPDGRLRNILPSRLPRCETVFAMTVHKSQGSEFDEVLFVLPERGSPVLSRELIYTAITRARKSVAIAARREVLVMAVGRTLDRFSGLAAMLDRAAVSDR